MLPRHLARRSAASPFSRRSLHVSASVGIAPKAKEYVPLTWDTDEGRQTANQLGLKSKDSHGTMQLLKKYGEEHK